MRNMEDMEVGAANPWTMQLRNHSLRRLLHQAESRLTASSASFDMRRIRAEIHFIIDGDASTTTSSMALLAV